MDMEAIIRERVQREKEKETDRERERYISAAMEAELKLDNTQPPLPEIRGSMMHGTLLQAAMNGDTSVLAYVNNFCNDYFLPKTSPEQENIIHIAVKSRRLRFMKEALDMFPTLIHDQDMDGNTPLHVAACQGENNIISLLISHLQNHNCSTATNNNNNGEDDDDDRRGVLAMNVKGNTPFHVAIENRKIEAAVVFCRECAEDQIEGLFHTTNHDARTPLHVVALHCYANDFLDDWDKMMTLYNDIFICADDLRAAQDIDGNTPLHLAIQSRNFQAAKLLVQRCLESEKRHEMSVKNNKGHSVFDLLEPEMLMTDMEILVGKRMGEEGSQRRKASHIFNGISFQSNQSNLWGHQLSIRNTNVGSVQAHTLDVVKNLKEMMMRTKRVAKEQALMERKMDDVLYKAAVTMDLEVFHGVRRRDGDIERGSIIRPDNANFLTQTANGSNIIHIALQQGKSKGVRFIEEALDRFPSLIFQADSYGDTPIHLAAKSDNPVSQAFLKRFSRVYIQIREQHKQGVLAQPWKAKNSKGNMPIHEALRTNNVYAALVLLRIDSDAASFVNNLGETPLHVYARYGFFPVDMDDQLFKTMITHHISAAYARDKDGLTPLLRAAKSGRFQIVRTLLECCPQSAYIRDPEGKTFLHLLHFEGGDVDEHSADQLFKQMGENLFKIPEADAQRLVLDHEGNTPLHYAIKSGNSIAAEIFTRRCLETEEQSELTLLNNDGETVLNLLASHEAPNEVLELIWKRHRNVMCSARSTYGVRRANIKDSAGSLSIIAGLLATITFAAAFQVPGGFDGDSGSPVLLQRAAFQVFLVSDAIAVCSSMLVLFSSLWVMGSNKSYDSFILLDICFFMLQASFYATLVAFMTGVYVATASKTLWLGIFSCVLCTIVVLLTWKRAMLFLSKHIRLLLDMLLTINGCSFKSYIEHHRSLHGNC